MRVDIATPVHDVFEFVADYRNALHFMEHFHTFSPLTPNSYGLGARTKAAGRLLGIPISAEFEIIEFEQNRRLVSQSRRGVSSTSQWLFEPSEAGTLVSFLAEYELPRLPLGSRLIGKVVDDEIRAGTRRTLENLKRVLEGRQHGRPDLAVE